MAEKLRSDYMSEVAARNATGLQKIKALQRRFQVSTAVGRKQHFLSFSDRRFAVSSYEDGQTNIQVSFPSV